MKMRLLIVDDEEQFLDSLAERLTLRNYDVTTASSGSDALDKIHKFNFDVVVLDVFMPDKNGLEVLQEVKRVQPLTEVLMLSGHAEVETAIEGMKAGAYDFLLKPAESDDLFKKIEKAYRRKADHEDRIREAKVADYIASPRSALDE